MILFAATFAFSHGSDGLVLFQTRATYERLKEATNYVQSYVMYDSRGCSGENDLGISTTDLEGCQALCDETDRCISFEYRKSDRKCQRSSTCTNSTSTVSSSEWTFFEKDFTYRFKSGGCPGRNEIEVLIGPSLKECKLKCNSYRNCASFEYNEKESRCQLSETCTFAGDYVSTDDGEWKLYEKLPPKITYKTYDLAGCPGKNNRIIEETPLDECQQLCSRDPSCTSFEYKTSSRKCQLSHDCKDDGKGEYNKDSPWLFFVAKRQE